MDYNLHKIPLNRSGSYIDSPKWLKNKQATINNDDKCFQYAVTVALNYQNIKSNSERRLEQYHWKEVDFPSLKKTGKKLN